MVYTVEVIENTPGTLYYTSTYVVDALNDEKAVEAVKNTHIRTRNTEWSFRTKELNISSHPVLVAGSRDTGDF